jgi:hypothetical protein
MDTRERKDWYPLKFKKNGKEPVSCKRRVKWYFSQKKRENKLSRKRKVERIFDQININIRFMRPDPKPSRFKKLKNIYASDVYFITLDSCRLYTVRSNQCHLQGTCHHVGWEMEMEI